MDSTTAFLARNQTLQDHSFMAGMADDINIDPMLHATASPNHLPTDTPRNADPRFVTNLAMWNSAASDQAQSFNMESFSPKSSNRSHPQMNSHASPWTSSNEVSHENSRTSSNFDMLSLPTSTSETTEVKAPKNTKNTRGKAAKTAKATQAQQRRSSAKKDAAKDGSPLAESAPAPSSRRRSTKASVVDEDEEEEDDDGEEMEDGSKRTKFLKRNRIAASKCRQKKKKWVNGLEGTKEELEQQRSALQTEHNELVNEVSRMKMQLMQHAGCDDSNINMWIDNEARRFVQKTAAKYQNAACNGINCCQHHRQPSEEGVQPMMFKSAESSTPEMMNFDHMPDQMLDPRGSFGL